MYELIEDAKLALTGMLDPDLQETFIGYAEIRQVFSVSKIGKIFAHDSPTFYQRKENIQRDWNFKYVFWEEDYYLPN